MTQLEVVYRDPAALKPYDRNARQHPKKQINQLVASVRAHNDYLSPIVIDEHNQILCGHGRLIAAKKLEMAQVPTIQLLGLSDLQKRSLRIADNRIPLNAVWDDDLLKLELAEIRSIDASFDFQVMGIESAEVDALTVKIGKGDDDEIPDVTETPVSRWGDIWRLGLHRIGCGDSQDPAFMRRVVGSDLVGCAFLDPPYNRKISEVVAAGRHPEFQMASGEMNPTEFRRFLHDGLAACVASSRPGAVHFICMDHHHVEDLIAACEGIYGARLNICVWCKTNGGMGSLYRSQHELVFVMRVGDAQHFNGVELGRHGRNRTNVWNYDGVNTTKKHRRGDLDLHPTVKPIPLVADAILDVTKANDLVLDGYLGSGTTLLACVRTGRRFRGIDIEPRYVDMALQRWMDLSGEIAVLEATGQSFEAVKSERARGDREDPAVER